MAKPSTTAADISSLKHERPAMQRMILEERWNLQIAKAVYELREKAGLSIKEVAKRAAMPISTVQRLEDADPRWVSLAQVLRLARVIGARLKIEGDYERLKKRQRKMSRAATKDFWNQERGDR
jgi:transcriptional regulator with XRE-family HTH domain